jgi:predicted enzyme related to lactoylglutathione lyase
MPAVVTETFFAVGVADMERATRFYVRAFGADAAFVSPTWSSLRIAGVRIGLVHVRAHAGGRIGVHFAVEGIHEALAAVAEAGGSPGTGPVEVAPGVVLAEITDTEGNTLTLRAD